MKNCQLSVPFCEGPTPANCLSQLLVCLVHLIHGAHENLQVDSDQGEQSAGEMHLAFHIYWHVHSYQPLVGQQVRAFAAKPKWRVDLLQQGKHVHVVYLAPKRWQGGS